LLSPFAYIRNVIPNRDRRHAEVATNQGSLATLFTIVLLLLFASTSQAVLAVAAAPAAMVLVIASSFIYSKVKTDRNRFLVSAEIEA